MLPVARQSMRGQPGWTMNQARLIVGTLDAAGVSFFFFFFFLNHLYSGTVHNTRPDTRPEGNVITLQETHKGEVYMME